MTKIKKIEDRIVAAAEGRRALGVEIIRTNFGDSKRMCPMTCLDGNPETDMNVYAEMLGIDLANVWDIVFGVDLAEPGEEFVSENKFSRCGERIATRLNLV